MVKNSDGIKYPRCSLAGVPALAYEGNWPSQIGRCPATAQEAARCSRCR
jgi:hypothetical protein